MRSIQQVVGHAVLQLMQTPPYELPDYQRPQVGLKGQLLRLGIVATLLGNLVPPLWGDGLV
jgi:hypothetical protein